MIYTILHKDDFINLLQCVLKNSMLTYEAPIYSIQIENILLRLVKSSLPIQDYWKLSNQLLYLFILASLLRVAHTDVMLLGFDGSFVVVVIEERL